MLRQPVPLRGSGSPCQSDLFTRVPSKNWKEERGGNGTGRGENQPRVLSQQSPVERNFGSVPGALGHMDHSWVVLTWGSCHWLKTAKAAGEGSSDA